MDAEKRDDMEAECWQVALKITIDAKFEFGIGFLAKDGTAHQMKIIPVILATGEKDLYTDATHSHRSRAIKITSETGHGTIYRGRESRKGRRDLV